MLPKKVLTFKERRRRADAEKIANDFDSIERSFLSFTQKLNKKRQAQLNKRINKLAPELIEAHEKGNDEEVEGLLKSLQMPSSKEWKKGLHKLTLTSVESGILRAHIEMLRLKELFEFDESWTPEVISDGYDYEVMLPEEAREYIKKNSYELGVITDETVLNRLRKSLEDGLEEGLTPKEMADKVQETAGTWMSPWHSETIARTETGKYYNAGRLTRWLDPEAGGFVEALQYDAIVDTRTTEVCRHLDGKIIAITDRATIAEFTPPNHFQCRATWLPVTRYEEWEDNFDKVLPPEKGFDFQSPLPKLLEGKKEPLVKVKPKIDPKYVIDPDVIRTLDDEAFKVAIRNVNDKKLKLSMISERAEEMAMKEFKFDTKVTPFSYKTESLNSREFVFVFKGETIKGTYLSQNHYDVFQLHKKLTLAKTQKEYKEIVTAFIEKHGDDWSIADLIVSLKHSLKLNKGSSRAMAGSLKKSGSSKADKDKFNVKRPPLAKNFKNADALRDALDKGEDWMREHIDPKVLEDMFNKFPGFTLRFSKDNKRAFARPAEGTIHFGSNAYEPSVIVHEMAHVIHNNNRDIETLIDSFFEKRTEGLGASSMNGSEKTIRDDFFDAYVGRIYGFDRKGTMGTEVFSMGLQEMYHNPANFYKQDKEHFLLTYAILKGMF